PSAMWAIRELPLDEHPATQAGPLSHRGRETARSTDGDLESAPRDCESHANDEPTEAAEDAQGAEHDDHDSPGDALLRPAEAQCRPEDHEYPRGEAHHEAIGAEEERAAVPVLGKCEWKEGHGSHENRNPTDETKHERKRSPSIATHSGPPVSELSTNHIILLFLSGPFRRQRGRPLPGGGPHTSSGAPRD